MFQQARLKLTAWYLLIIILISTSFSVGIFFVVSFQLERNFYQAEMRYRARQLDPNLLRGPGKKWENLPLRSEETEVDLLFSPGDLKAAKQKVAFGLLMANGVILFVSALSGYFLAGKTLAPIEYAMEGQKRFIADASHELRTPLTALRTLLEVNLRDKKLSLKEARSTIKSSLEEVKELEELSRWLLKLAKNQEKRLEKEELDLGKLIKELAVKFKPLAGKRQVRLKVKTKKALVFADKQKLKEMIAVFLDNAIKYSSKKSEVKITLTTKKDKVCLEIKDSGIGIAKRELPHIFRRFYRTDTSRTRTKEGGFGLGLSLAKQIVELHRGKIEVESGSKKGTIFRITLPS